MKTSAGWVRPEDSMADGTRATKGCGSCRPLVEELLSLGTDL
ncbi:hypothetical protein [Streptomyces sp. KR80]